MKKLSFFISMILLVSSAMFAQVGISTDNSAPDNSAMLDVKSSNKGILPPRLTLEQIFAIPTPAEGLYVYNMTLHIMCFFDGTIWRKTDGTGMISIGTYYGGGIIFYVDGTGQHGLIAAPYDQSSGAQWGCSGNTIGGTSTAIGTGQTNTTLIVNGCSTLGIAARICNDLVLNVYNDWFLPSKEELNLLYLQKNVVGGFANNYYWSSSEYQSWYAWELNFSNGNQDFNDKSFGKYVRAVRAF